MIVTTVVEMMLSQFDSAFARKKTCVPQTVVAILEFLSSMAPRITSAKCNQFKCPFYRRCCRRSVLLLVHLSPPFLEGRTD